MNHLISILHLEDNPIDLELVHATLEAAGLACTFTVAQTRQEFEQAVRKGGYDVILADYRLPSYDGTSALRFAREQCPEIPFIFVSGTIGEDAAIEGLTQGATDYVLKQKLSRIAPAIRRALEDAENRHERQRAERELHENAERFRAVAEHASEAIISVNSQGMIIQWNKAASIMFDYSSTEILGRSVLMLVPERYRDRLGDPQFLTTSHFLDQVGKVYDEAFGRRKDGSEFPVEVSAGSWDTQEGRFYSIMVRDITDRRQVEEKLRLQSAALEAAANAIVITERDGTITWVNQAFTSLTGFTAEEAIGQNLRILKSGSHDQQFYQNLWDTILAGEVWHEELINRRKDGHLYVEEMTIAPVTRQRGEISHFVAIKQDISERKRHEQEREAIISVADAIRSTMTRAELVSILLNQIKDLFSADGAMLSAPSRTQGEAIIEMGCGPTGERFIGLRIPPGSGICQQVMTLRKQYVSNLAHIDPRFFRPDLLGDAHAVACVPLIAQEHVIGALWIARQTEITGREVSLLTAIANLAANAIHRVALNEQTEQQLRQMAGLHQIDMAIIGDMDLNNVLNVVLNHVIVQLGVDAADVLLLFPYRKTLEYAAGRGFRTPNIAQSCVRLGEGRAGLAALERRLIVLPDLDQAQDRFSRVTLLQGESFVSHIVAPLIAKGEVQGVLEIFHRQRMEPTAEWLDFFVAIATQAAIAIENANLLNDLQMTNSQLVQSYDATIEGWVHALDLRDKETEGHTLRVTEMTLRMAQAMRVDPAQLVHLRRGAILHDIGKMGIPDDILFKPSSLTEAEWVVMRKHPVYAYEMLSKIHYLQPALEIPYCHHEKWDGSGYPRGLQGEQIPLAARIFAIIDVWDALRTHRRYREAWEEPKVLAYLREQAGKHFDPQVVEDFLRVRPWKDSSTEG